jgi:hypothetical protein
MQGREDSFFHERTGHRADATTPGKVVKVLGCWQWQHVSRIRVLPALLAAEAAILLATRASWAVS